jgi:hypothetical protein
MKVEITQRFAAKTRSESKNVAGKVQMPEVLRGSLGRQLCRQLGVYTQFYGAYNRVIGKRRIV